MLNEESIDFWAVCESSAMATTRANVPMNCRLPLSSLILFSGQGDLLPGMSEYMIRITMALTMNSIASQDFFLFVKVII